MKLTVKGYSDAAPLMSFMDRILLTVNNPFAPVGEEERKWKATTAASGGGAGGGAGGGTEGGAGGGRGVSGGGSAVSEGGLPEECIADIDQSQPPQRTGTGGQTMGETTEPANEWSTLDQVRPWRKRKRKRKRQMK